MPVKSGIDNHSGFQNAHTHCLSYSMFMIDNNAFATTGQYERSPLVCLNGVGSWTEELGFCGNSICDQSLNISRRKIVASTDFGPGRTLSESGALVISTLKSSVFDGSMPVDPYIQQEGCSANPAFIAASEDRSSGWTPGRYDLASASSGPITADASSIDASVDAYGADIQSPDATVARKSPASSDMSQLRRDRSFSSAEDAAEIVRHLYSIEDKTLKQVHAILSQRYTQMCS